MRSRFSVTLSAIFALLVPAACASRPAAMPATESSPSTALTSAGTGVAEEQPSPQPPADDIVFVEKEHKEPATRDGAAPATSLHVETSGRKQHLGHLSAE
jgi:hypothetical protein